MRSGAKRNINDFHTLRNKEIRKIEYKPPEIIETGAEMYRRKEKVCRHCRYYLLHDKICDYLETTGNRRGCHPTECKEKGVFAQKKENKKVRKKSLSRKRLEGEKAHENVQSE